MENQNIKQELLSILGLLAGSLGGLASINIDHFEVVISSESIYSFVEQIKTHPRLKFNMLLDITAVDWMDQKNSRYEIVYHFLSIELKNRVRIKVSLDESKPNIKSITELYSSALCLEREVFDMYGINFEGHPDLRRILMYPEFKGYPLRKDYPVQAKQPRIELRAPEVQNTATFMNRPTLYSINNQKKQNLSRETI